MNFLKLIRNNWKKAAFASCVSGYALYSAKTHYSITKHMRSVCSQVSSYGNVHDGTTPKHVLVIINPVANKKKAEKTFKKYCEPILHLAGYSVELFNTKFIGHAKSYVENLKVLPDAIVVAGGDGTSSEVVTGLLRRNDAPCPIVLLPLGVKSENSFKYNSILKPSNKEEYVKALSSSLLPMLQEKAQYGNVIKFDVIDTDSPAESGDSDVGEKKLKPIYGLNRFSWGVLRDIETEQDKYWYFGSLRHYAAALFKSFSHEFSRKINTEFVYTPPCPGCRNCTADRQRDKSSNSILSKLLPIKVGVQNNNATKIGNKQHLENENCSVEIQGQLETSQLDICCNKNMDSFYELETKVLNNLKPSFDLIKNISDMARPSLVLKSRTIQLLPTSITEKSFYSIDGEEYDVRPVKVSLVQQAIKIFC